ncbi:hypothetical protein [Mesorhizobium sp. Root552]|uniref:hypothetical protein n=1 Tax=Mesorhizobium sp. Root552 TaxID=1736555 RepID=UPI000A5453FE|nr:hypothetical protein [Mesorhizobium sp. Root552]
MTATEILSDYIDREALARGLGISTRTLWRYENQPDGLPSLMIGGRKFYRLQTVRDWFEKRETRPNPRRAA